MQSSDMYPENETTNESGFLCSCKGEMVPRMGNYHPGIMVLVCRECGSVAERPCTCAGQSGYCNYCGEQLDTFMNS